MERRVRGIVIDENALLQIHRNKKDEDYYVFPGGGVEGAETDEEALLREFIEELRVEIEILQKTPFFTHYLPCGDEESFYFCQITSGELGTGDGPEFQKENNYEGTYNFEWIPLADIKGYNLLPESVKVELLKLL